MHIDDTSVITTQEDLSDGYFVCRRNGDEDLVHPVPKPRNMISNEDAIERLGELKLLSLIPWDKGYVFLAGGYTSRTILGDDPSEGDVDLFLYGDYNRDDIRCLLNIIQDTYKCVWWYRYGSVIVAVVPITRTKGSAKDRMEIQIICTDHHSKKDIIEAFDASYVQCGYDGKQIIYTDDFIRFTPHSLAKITRPTCSPLRLKKCVDRGFTPIVRTEQHLLCVIRSKHDVSFMNTVTMDQAIEEVNIHGHFNPYTELDYIYSSDVDIVPCTVTLKDRKSQMEAYEGDEVIYSRRSGWSIDHIFHDSHEINVMQGDTLLDPKEFIGKTLSGWKLVSKDDDKTVQGFRLMASIE